jgi:hypothetical protein
MIGLGILTVVVAAVVFFLASRPEQETAE